MQNTPNFAHGRWPGHRRERREAGGIPYGLRPTAYSLSRPGDRGPMRQTKPICPDLGRLRRFEAGKSEVRSSKSESNAAVVQQGPRAEECQTKPICGGSSSGRTLRAKQTQFAAAGIGWRGSSGRHGIGEVLVASYPAQRRPPRGDLCRGPGAPGCLPGWFDSDGAGAAKDGQPRGVAPTGLRSDEKRHRCAKRTQFAGGWENLNAF